MKTFLNHWFKIFSRIFSVAAILVFVLVNILNPSLINLNTARASVNGLGVTFGSSDGATWSGTVYNDVGSGYQGGQQVTSLFRAFHCNRSNNDACADDLGLGGDFDRVLDSQSYILNVPAQGSSQQISFMIPSVSCGRVQVDLGAAGGILGGQVFPLGQDCGSAGGPAPPPPSQQPQYGPLNVAASSSCGSAGNMQISSSWSNIGAASYQATLQISSNTVASTCVGAATSYNFGNYPIRNDANYIVSVFAYSGANCSGNTVMNGNFGVDRPSCAAPAPASAPACPTFGAGTAVNFGTTTYDICTDNAGGQSINGSGNLCSSPSATSFSCVSSINSACQSGMVYGCPAQSSSASCSISPSFTSLSIGVGQNFYGNFNPGTNSNRYATDYFWNFGDGNSRSTGSSNQSFHIYNNSGTYPVNLTVRASDGNQVSCIATASVSGSSPPISCFITPQNSSGFAPFSANFTGNLLSSGSGGVTYSWDLNDDGIFGDATGTSASATFNRSSTVRLNVRDANNQSNSCFAVVSILNIAQGQPFCTLNVSSNPINTGNSVTLTANYNSNSTGSAQSYNFSFGDGQSSSGSNNSTTHTYNSAGSFGPSVRITDSRGNQVSCSSSLTVNRAQGTVQLATVQLAGGQVVAPRVVQVAGIEARELPRSGLPTLFWAAGAFLPVGLRLRRFEKGEEGNSAHPNYLWEVRAFKSLY